MRLLFVLGATCTAMVLGCQSAPATPTTAPAPAAQPTTASAASAAASPAVAASPAAVASPAAKPSASPSSSASPSPLAVGSPVAIPQMAMSGTATPGFTLQSSAFKDGDTLPTEFTCA